MGLNARGIIAAILIVVYIPILVVSFIVALRHGFLRRSGWVFLIILSLVRIIGGGMHIAAEVETPPSTGVIIGYSILEAAGLSPLLVATVGFLKTIGEGAFDDQPLITRGLRIMGLLGTVALALVIGGGTQATAADPSKGSSLRHIGIILFIVLFVIIVFVHFYYWNNRSLIMMHRRRLLIGISLALPFLAVRVLYGALSSFAPQNFGQTSSAPSDNGLAKFNSRGPWAIWLFMSVLMELIAVIIYVITGLRTPLEKDYEPKSGQSSEGAWSNRVRNDQEAYNLYAKPIEPYPGK